MKLEVGMYVRTKYGITQYRKYNTVNQCEIICMPVKDGTNGIFANLEDIIGEPSFNPIDLIEVGDYVNGEKVVEIEDNIIKTGNEVAKTIVFDSDIKLIVTKEQFESMSYKVGESNE